MPETASPTNQDPIFCDIPRETVTTRVCLCDDATLHSFQALVHAQSPKNSHVGDADAGVRYYHVSDQSIVLVRL